jgi:hypothetical protein
MKMRLLAGAAALALSAAGAQAATINSIGFNKANYDAQRALLGPNVIVEDFETSGPERNVPQGFPTKVGNFSTLGGTGSGGTVQDPVSKGNFPGNNGNLLAIRDGNVYGRTSTTDLIAGAANSKTPDLFLDSNDTDGIKWVVGVGSMFNKLIFTLTDAADQRAILRITTAGAQPIEFRSQASGNRQIIIVDFGGFVNSAEITMRNFFKNGRRDDGFSIDDVAVSVVPLPAPAFMLLAGLAGFAAFRRKRAAA